MAERLAERGIPADKIHIAENWADGTKIRPTAFPRGPLTVLYSGNLGLAHEVDTIRGTMLRLRDDDRVRFVFAGGGYSRNGLEDFCRRNALERVAFRPYCDLAELGQRLSEGHVGLVTQKMETVGCVVPSKVYGIMAAGRPVLYVGPKKGTPARIIEQFRCGWQVDCGKADGLAELLGYLAEHREEVEEGGRRARLAFEAHYDLPAGVARVCEILGVSVHRGAPAPEGLRGPVNRVTLL
jgi:glycosyltransferase involved in cell wall biosynthesis